mmetsp:Transcript_18607/g.26200  ORF Transcript_18607/g.26200 Transcript_18607/m.26200 type:complete len:320 (-) Transcript_18607:109-1068(-)|eukprot:CAMPEP_0184863538 /NCGR_PEP_ID=MMETSP0580-20130426/11513_1 /TAXON_ID=1118495 /ORGANISM="Dactyliosolen fragilissimus" /LENGTH=319 /DNA_ID=CAMNT_0027361925 /DNA_START=149 /DNA_END=1108 /DNA_ORIENTATION=+
MNLRHHVIRYFIPEDGDSEEYPNVFLTTKSQTGFSPKLREVKKAFPLPGRYHFRFKAPLIPGTDREKNAIPVWMDCVDDNQNVGVWRNAIFAKVSRIGIDDDESYVQTANNIPASAATRPRSANNAPQRASAPPQSAVPTRSNPPPPPNTSNSLLGAFDEAPPQATAAAATPPVTTTTTTTTTESDLLGVGTAPVSTATPIHPSGSLLDMDGPTTTTISSSSSNNMSHSAHDDFLGMTASPTVQTTHPQVAQPPPIQSLPPPQQPQTAMGGVGVGVAVQSNASMSMNTVSSSMNKNSGKGNAFSTFSNQAGPFGGLEWK